MDFLGKQGFYNWIGVVEDRHDPLKLGRVRVRIVGYHTKDKQQMPTNELPWAQVLFPADTGRNVVGLKERDWVGGFFLDDDRAQEPVVLGKFAGIPEEISNPTIGYMDPTPDPDLTPQKQPRPPEMSPIPADVSGSDNSGSSLFSNASSLPGDNTAFGQLSSQFSTSNYKFDVNNDGVYNAIDAKTLSQSIQASNKLPSSSSSISNNNSSGPISRYPLDTLLKEPDSSRLARAEKLSLTIVAKKLANLVNSGTATHPGSGVGTDAPHITEPFSEPPTPYDAKYPFNHVYDSESGHVHEIDDTPQKERLHQYHRSGSFVEVHPNGTKVTKVVKKNFELVTDNHFFNTAKNATITANKDMYLKSKEYMNIESDIDMNHDVGRDSNSSIARNVNTRVNNDVFIVIGKDGKIVIKGNLDLSVTGDIKIKAGGNFLVDAANIRTTAAIENVVAAGIATITDAPITSLGGELAGDIRAVSALSIGAGPLPPIPSTVTESNDADDISSTIQAFITPKPGFILSGPAGDIYKPISDSDGKLVTISNQASASHELYEALPTGALQTLNVQFKNADNSITTWNVVRPVHTLGRFIESGRFSSNPGEEMQIYRFSQPGSSYPKQMFLKMGTKQYLILDSSVRHASFGGPLLGY